MRRTGFAVILFMLMSWNAFAADLNGYTARYECRAGGPYCDLDVVALGTRPCDQIIAVSTPWSI